MSIASTRTYTCHYPECDEDRTSSQYGSYCSEECRLRHSGLKQLRNIKQDHRFCGTCYKPIKTVYRPEDRVTPKLREKAVIIRDSFVGFEDLTEHAQYGQYGLECNCGNVDHFHTEEAFREGESYEWWLKLAFQTFRKEGQIESTFDIEVFCNAFWETEDIELAVGRALE